MYENIDMERTGILLKEMFDKSGYTVKDIQYICHAHSLYIDGLKETFYHQ